MTDVTCRHCEARPSPNGWTVCRACITTTRGHLWAAASLAAHLDDKRAKITAATYERTSRPSTTPLPYDLRVTPTETTALATTTSTIRLLASRGHSWPSTTKPTLTAQLVWLHANIHHLAPLEEAATHLTHLDLTHKALAELFDNDPDAIYLGPCGSTTDEGGTTCDTALTIEVDHRGRPTSSTVKCARCRTTYDVADRRAWVEAITSDYLLTMTELVTLYAGNPSRRTLERLISTGLLKPAGQVQKRSLADGVTRRHNAYRVGDVTQAIIQRRTAKRATSKPDATTSAVK